MNFLWLMVGLAVGFIGGYCTCFFWGSSRKAIKKAAGDVAYEVQDVAEKVKKQ